MKPLCKNSGEIIAALQEIENTDTFKADVCFEAGSLADKIDYVFICCACVWYDILCQTNIASKALQSIQSNVQTALISLESVLKFLLKYKDYGCEKVLQEAKDICEHISINLSLMIKNAQQPDQPLQMRRNFEENPFCLSSNLRLVRLLNDLKH